MKREPPNSGHFQRILLSLLMIFIAACSSSKTIQKPPSFQYSDLTLSKSVAVSENKGTPADVSNEYFTRDPAVYAYLNLENLSGKHKIRWEWYDPDGKLYASTRNASIKASSGKYHENTSAWHKLNIQGDPAENQPGQWKVKVFLDNDLAIEKLFSIVDGKTVMASAPMAPPISTQQIFPDDWAMVIGIEDYATLPRVEFARKDAFVVKAYFNKILGVPSENIITLIDSQATKSRIKGYLKKYLPSNLSEKSTLYVYFAGHGAPDMDNGSPYLIPYDGDTLFIEETSYELKTFFSEIDAMDINQAYVFLDSCFSGVASRAAEMLTKGTRPALVKVESVELASQDVIAIGAATSGQTSNAYPKEQHGLFTFYLLKALDGQADVNEDRFITIKEIYAYLNLHIPRVSRRLGKEQTPVIMPEYDDIKDVSVAKMAN